MIKKMFSKARAVAAAVLVATVMVVAVPATAFAQEVASTVVNFQPLLDFAITTVGLIVTAVLPFLINKWIGGHLDAKSREALSSALEYGMNFGVAKLKEVGGNFAKVDVKNAAIATAADYVVKATPDALIRFNITPERLKDLLLARLESWDETPIAPTAAVK